MTTGYSNAANWLQQVSGPNANGQVLQEDGALIRGIYDMQDAEAKAGEGAHALPPPKLDGRAAVGRNAVHSGRAHVQQRPKPKFVAHKDPTPPKKKKVKGKSNRLGNNLHMA